MQPLSWRARLVLGLAQERVGAFRFFWSNHAVAIAVDALEIFPAAKELAAGDHAVAVGIHLAGPERAPGRRRRAAFRGALGGHPGGSGQGNNRPWLRLAEGKLARGVF